MSRRLSAKGTADTLRYTVASAPCTHPNQHRHWGACGGHTRCSTFAGVEWGEIGADGDAEGTHGGRLHGDGPSTWCARRGACGHAHGRHRRAQDAAYGGHFGLVCDDVRGRGRPRRASSRHPIEVRQQTVQFGVDACTEWRSVAYTAWFRRGWPLSMPGSSVSL
jgi:hypothetical protein